MRNEYCLPRLMSSRTAERLGWIGRLVSPRWDRRGCAARVDERRTEFVGSEKIEIRFDVWIGVSLGHRVGRSLNRMRRTSWLV